jgi:hypothetical protein
LLKVKFFAFGLPTLRIAYNAGVLRNDVALMEIDFLDTGVAVAQNASLFPAYNPSKSCHVMLF